MYILTPYKMVLGGLGSTSLGSSFSVMSKSTTFAVPIALKVYSYKSSKSNRFPTVCRSTEEHIFPLAKAVERSLPIEA